MTTAKSRTEALLEAVKNALSAYALDISSPNGAEDQLLEAMLALRAAYRVAAGLQPEPDADEAFRLLGDLKAVPLNEIGRENRPFTVKPR